MSGKGSRRRAAAISDEQMERNWATAFAPKPAAVGYDPRHDAEFDATSREWLESACSNPGCCFCKDRPDKAP